MPDIVVALVAILIGLVGCFYGYPAFRVYLPVAGLVYGYFVGRAFIAPEQGLTAGIIGVVVGIVFAALAYFFWSLMVTIAGVLLGIGMGALLGIALNADQPIILLFAAIGGVLLGFLFYVARDLMVMLSTAFSGAGAILYGLALLIPALAFLNNPNNFIAYLIWLALGLVGFGVQYGMHREKDLYARRQAI